MLPTERGCGPSKSKFAGTKNEIESPAEQMSWDEFIEMLHDKNSADEEIREKASNDWTKIDDKCKFAHLHRLFMENKFKELRAVCIESLETAFRYKRNEIVRVWTIPRVMEFRKELLRAVRDEKDFEMKDKLAELCGTVRAFTGWKLKEQLESWASSSDAEQEITALLVYGSIMNQYTPIATMLWATKTEENKLQIESIIPVTSLPTHTTDPLESMEPLIAKGVNHEEATFRRAALKALGSIQSEETTAEIVPISDVIQRVKEKCYTENKCSGVHSEALRCMQAMAKANKIQKCDVNNVIDACCETLHGELGVCRSEGDQFTAMVINTVLCETHCTAIEPRNIARILTGGLFVVGDAMQSDKEWKDDPSVWETIPVQYCNWFFTQIAQWLITARKINSRDLKTIFNQILTDENWKRRAAGLIALACLEEDIPKYWKKILPDLKGFVVRSCTDTHHRVRFLAWKLFGFATRELAENGTVFDETDLVCFKAALKDPVSEVADAASLQFGLAQSLTVFSEALIKANYDGLMSSIVKRLNEIARDEKETFYVLFMTITMSSAVDPQRLKPYFAQVVRSLRGRPIPDDYCMRVFLTNSKWIHSVMGEDEGKPLVDAILTMIGGGSDGPLVLANLVKAIHSGSYNEHDFITDAINNRIIDIASDETIKAPMLTKDLKKTIKKIIKNGKRAPKNH